MKKSIYSINDLKAINGTEVLHHVFHRIPDFILAEIEYTDVSMLGTVKDPCWRCKGNYGKYCVDYCFGKTLEEAQMNVCRELAKQWFNDSRPIRENSYARVMWM